MLPEKSFFKKYTEEKNIPWQDRNILMEYLQTQILKALSLGKYGENLSFLGGTCLRFIYGIDRFSEDLDFDLIKKKDFNIDSFQEELVRNLTSQGFEVDARNKTTEKIHIIFFKFRKVLQEFGFRVHWEEKFLVKFEIDFDPFKKIETKTSFADLFNEKFPLIVNTLPTIFAQKIIAMKMRPYQKGRDFYDLIWFLAQRNLEPNYALLQEMGIKVKNKKELIKEMEKIITKLDLKEASEDVKRFLFYPQKAKWILDLPKYLKDFASF